ncbi:MAG: PEP-CTERM sorting domain-containing protein [Verrucomicrobiaceae bacterium]
MKTMPPMAFGLLIGFANAQSYVADFSHSGFHHGTILTGNEYDSLLGGGFNFALESKNGLDTAIIFDTRQTGTADPDLELPIIGGNLVGAQLNDILIFANDLDGGKDGIVDRPNDSADGGSLSIRFNANNVNSFGFALVDAPQQGEQFGITFYDSSRGQVTLSFEEYLEVSGTKGFVAGDNYANQFANTSASQLGLQNIQAVRIDLLASGGIDNITWSEGVPEPSSALLSLAAAGLLLRRRR